MNITILATKLYIPPSPPNGIPRPRLIERLNAGLHHKITLISAPAGFGKTTLVSEWLDSSGRPSAWLSLDEGDSDPVRFLAYLIAALRTVSPEVGAKVYGALHSPQPLPIEPILTALLNEITILREPFVLVLDDYHVVEDGAIDKALAFWIEHMPPTMHLVITTREDPQLPLARLRARNQMTELRASDLRFTPAEAAGFLREMGLDLAAEDLAALEERTEGWIAGLQLAALAMQSLSLQEHQDIPGFIQAFAGDNRYIMDYLLEEVLYRQPEPVRRFLLQTAILDRLSGSLCNAVTGQADGSAQLRALEHGNFFILPLDDQRRWYRYHHLFADVLKMHLLMEQPEQVPALHRRASIWFEQHGSADEAIHHALAAEDFARAAELIERAVPDMRRSRQEATMLGWLLALPDAIYRSRPVLSIYYVGARLVSGALEGVETRLRDAERWLEAAEMGQKAGGSPAELPAGMVVVDEAEFHRLPGWIAIYRAGIALTQGDVDDTVRCAHRAMELAAEDDHLGHGAAAGFLGFTHWMRGELDAACRYYASSIERMQKASHLSDAIGLAIALADVQKTQGHLHEAMQTYERGLQLATGQGGPVRRGAADMLVGMSEILCQRNKLEAAAQHLQRSEELGEINGLPQNRYRRRVAMARLREAQGAWDAALDLLSEAERVYVSDYFPNVRPIAAMKAGVWAAQGRLDEARAWATEQGVSAEDDLSYLREFEHITLARVMLAEYARRPVDRALLETRSLLERLLKAAEAGGRLSSAIEILILQALAFQAQGDVPAALQPLRQALALAEPEGYVRVFVDEGASMALLLREAALRGILPDYSAKLLKAWADTQGKNGSQPAREVQRLVEPEVHPLEEPADQPLIEPEAQPLIEPQAQPLVEPLSERELEVLRLFKTELSGPEIAQELTIALSTVRTHTKSIYSKLNVNSRRAAVRRAAELHLI